MSISDVLNEIKKAQEAEYHRGKSWEHCFAFFRDYKRFRDNDDFLDRAALHLGFFLASWGMLRGSSFLLQKDFKYYVPIIRTLIKSKYDRLWHVDYLKLMGEKEDEMINLLFDLKDDLRRVIKKNNHDHKEPTDLLITKIIMATMGCAPAYDTYFKIGLKNIKMKNHSNFNKQSFRNLLNLCKRNKKLHKFYTVSWIIKGTNFKYPAMKLFDLYFWLLGQS